MITILDGPAVGPAHWPDLIDELDRWRAEGRIATLWWRDDDAVAPSQRLNDVLAVAQGVPIALAVIPALAQAELADRLDRDWPVAVRVLQHGWRHANYDAAGKKSEFPKSRSREAIVSDLSAGRARLTGLFGERALGVLAPPWNRFDDALLPLLTDAGLTAISRIKPRRVEAAAPGVVEANVHVDLVAWRGGRGFVGTTPTLGELIAHLQARRCGTVDVDEPTGILTHHLVHDEATLAFLGRLIELTGNHPGARWVDAADMFASSGAGTEGAERT